MNYVIFDNETDGLIGTKKIRQEKWPRVIEFYGALFNEAEKIGEVDALINPNRKISEEITGITGITNDMLIGQPTFQEKYDEIKALIEKANFAVAHNLTFDKTVIDLEVERLSLSPIKWPALICTVEASEHYLMRRLKLMELHEYLFGEGFPAAHRARNDVEALTKCFFEMKRLGDI